MIHLRITIVLGPLLAAIAMPVLGRAWKLASIGGMSWPAIAKRCSNEFCSMLQDAGIFGTALFLAGNLASFGVLIVTCWAVSYFWHPKRVLCILICGVGSAIGVWICTSAYLDKWERIISDPRIPPRVMWPSELFEYRLLALVGIPIGALIALLPIFRPDFSLERLLFIHSEYPQCR